MTEIAMITVIIITVVLLSPYAVSHSTSVQVQVEYKYSTSVKDHVKCNQKRVIKYESRESRCLI
jgi:diphthamide biosynthesis methyltransferase